MIQVGRNIASKFCDRAKIEVSFEKVKKFHQRIDMNDKLAGYQKLVVAASIERLRGIGTEPTGEVQLQLDTGLGKTRVGIGIMTKISAKTVVAVPTKHIAQQWIDELTKIVPELKVLLYGNQLKGLEEKFIEADVVVGVFNTLREKDSEFYKNFALMLIDEVHECTSSKNKELLWMGNGVRFVCGLTATPEYSGHGLLPFINGFLGEPLISRNIEGFEVTDVTFKVKVRTVTHYPDDRSYLIPVMNEVGGNISSTMTIGRLVSDPSRHDKVMWHIKRLYGLGHNVLVFCEHRNYCDKLLEDLGMEYGKVVAEDSGVLKGGVKKDELEVMGKHRIVMTTYCYSRRGINYSHLNALVLATPRRTGLKQVLGRILRFNSDTSIVREVVDIWDCASVLKSQYQDRRAVYLERKYEMTQ